MKLSQRSITYEDFYRAQKHHAVLIKQLQKSVYQLIELVELLLKNNNGRN